MDRSARDGVDAPSMLPSDTAAAAATATVAAAPPVAGRSRRREREEMALPPPRLLTVEACEPTAAGVRCGRAGDGAAAGAFFARPLSCPTSISPSTATQTPPRALLPKAGDL